MSVTLPRLLRSGAPARHGWHSPAPRRAAGVAAGDLDLGCVHERIDELRIGRRARGCPSARDRSRPRSSTSGRSSRAARRSGAPRVLKARRMLQAPSIQNGAAPSMQLLRMLIATSHAGIDRGPRDVALETAAMAEPVPAVGLAACDAETVMHLGALRDAPMLARHLAAACDGEHAAFLRWARVARRSARCRRRWRQSPPRRPSRARDCRRGSTQTPAERLPSRVAARERRALRQAACSARSSRRPAASTISRLIQAG